MAIMIKIAGTVVLYNADKNVISNIYSYLDQVNKLYIIDNSHIVSEFIKNEFLQNQKVVYLANQRNIGIAAALNLALNFAEQDGYEYLLTMDQDSYFDSTVVEKMLNRIIEDAGIAILSARHHFPIGKNETEENHKGMDNLVVMTSGNIVRVKVLRSAGGYKDELFIDYVDHEICLRLNNLGYRIRVCNECKVIHSLGNVEEKNFFGKKIYPTNHSCTRHYYQTRNRLFVYKTYKKLFPAYFRSERVNFIKNILKIVLFEEQKRKKIKFIFRGFQDFRKNIFGEYKGNLDVLIVFILFMIQH